MSLPPPPAERPARPGAARPTTGRGVSADKAQRNVPRLSGTSAANRRGRRRQCDVRGMRVSRSCLPVTCRMPPTNPSRPSLWPRRRVTPGPRGMERPRDARRRRSQRGDSGQWRDRAAAVAALAPRGFDPSMATGRQRPRLVRPRGPQAPATAPARMAAKVRTPPGQALDARRKGMVEPVSGQITEVRGVRRVCAAASPTSRGVASGRRDASSAQEVARRGCCACGLRREEAGREAREALVRAPWR